MTDPKLDRVTPMAEARAGLSGILREFRNDPANALPVSIGSHRKPEAVLVPFEQYRVLAGGTYQRPGAMLEALHKRAPLIRRLARLNKVETVAVFGSVARGEDTASSDIDVLVGPMEGATLLDLAQLEIDLEILTGRAVQVVSRRSLDSAHDSAILAEAIEL